MLLTKFALLLSGLLGWNSISSVAPATTSLNFNEYGFGQNTVGGGGGYPFQNSQSPYRPSYGVQNSGITPYGHVIREVINVYDADSDAERSEQSSRSGKNFVWTRDD